MELIATASSTAPVSIRDYMERLAALDNVPRKPKQFRNFASNSLNLRGKHATDVVDSMWNHLSQLREKEQEAKKKEEEEQSSLQEEAKKRKESEEVKNVNVETPSNVMTSSNNNKKGSEGKSVSAKKVRKAMKKVLKKAPGRSMKVKELRRAVRQYLECEDVAKPKVKQMIGDELKSDNDRIKVEGKLVMLR